MRKRSLGQYLIAFVFFGFFIFPLRAADQAPNINSEQQPETQIQPYQEYDRKARIGEPAVVAPVQVLARCSQGESQRCQEQSKEQGTEFWPPFYGYRLKVTDTLVTAFTGLLFFATYALWLATRSLAKGADDQLEHLRDASRRELRAYMLIETVSFFQPEGTGRSHINGILKNFGKTPCYKGTLRLEVDICPEKPPEFVIPLTEKAEVRENVIMAPDHFFTLNFDRSAEVSGRWVDLAENGYCAYFWGRFDYQDAFGEPHFTTFQLFCPFFSATSFVFSKVGNDAD